MVEKQQLAVTAAIIEKDGTFLLTQRPLDKHNGGRREFPGGTVERGEDLRECLVREIQEELGIVISVHEPFEYSSKVYNDTKHVILLAFHCLYISGTITKHDIADYVRATPTEMDQYDITEADHAMVEKLKYG